MHDSITYFSVSSINLFYVTLCFCYLSKTNKKHTASKKDYRLLANTIYLYILYISILALSYTRLSPP